MRLIRLMLALLLLLCSAPLSAFAEGEEDPLWNRPSFEKKVFRIGQRILQANGITERITFLVNNADIRNASAHRSLGTKNTIVIYKDLLDIIESDDELAAVLSHETAHIIKRHHARGYARSIPAMILMGVLAGVAAYGGTPMQPGVASAGAAGLSQPMMKSLETEADNVGVDYMVKAGYNPLAMETLMAKITSDGGAVTTFFSSHPLGSKRLDNIREQITTKYPEFLTPEVANNLPGAPFQHQGVVSGDAAKSPGENAPAVPSATTDEYEAFYKKLAMIAETGSTEKTEGKKETPETVAPTAEDSVKKDAPVETSVQTVPGVEATKQEALAIEGYIPGVTPAASSKGLANTPAKALRKPPQSVSYANTTDPGKTGQPPAKTVEAEVSGSESVAQILLGLKPDELRLIKALSRDEYMDRGRLQEEFGGINPEALDILVQALQRKKLVRIVGAGADEMILLSDWASAELKR